MNPRTVPARRLAAERVPGWFGRRRGSGRALTGASLPPRQTAGHPQDEQEPGNVERGA